MKRYFWNLLLSIDQLGNALTGGYPDETISSRVGKAASKGGRAARIAEKVIDTLLGSGHCRNNIEHDEGEIVDK